MTPIKIRSALLLGVTDHGRTVAVEALNSLSPGLTISELLTSAETLASDPSAQPDVLIIGRAQSCDLAPIVSARDRLGRHRWAIVSLDARISQETTLVYVPHVAWTAESAPSLITLALRVYELTRELEVKTGDLTTLGRRVSHDLRAPLSAIVSATEVIRDGLKSSDPDSLIFTQIITDSVAEQERTIRRTSFLIGASSQTEVFQRVSMVEPVRTTLERLERRIIDSGAEILQPADWPVVDGVVAWLEMIWLDLISNALEHSKVESPRIALSWCKKGNEFQFSVRDNGRGVSQEKSASLFFPFEQLHRLDAPRGLGLSIVQRLTGLQGGSCVYAPAQPTGSEFSFLLPVAVAKQPEY